MRSRILLALILCLGVVTSAQAQSWNLSGEWPDTLGDGTLPMPAVNGVWSYGYGGGFDKVALTYNFRTWTQTAPGQWGLMNNGVYRRADGAPFVGKNHGSSWPGADMPIGAVGGHSDTTAGSGNTAFPMVFRFTAPEDMVVNIVAKGWVAYKQSDAPGDAQVGGRDFYMNVLKGPGNPLLDETIVPFHWDSGILESDQPTIVSVFNIALSGGDVLDLIEWNKAEAGMRGLDITVEVVPEPASMLVLATGLVGLLGFRKRN